MRPLVFALPLFFACSKSEPAPPSPGPAAPGKSTASAAAASAAPSAAPAPPAAVAPSGPKNVLFVTIDSLRTDSFTKEFAPNLHALAERCTTYENAYSVSSYTAKSVATFLSGYYPSTLYRSGYFFASYGEANDFMAEQLQKNGVATFAWFGHMYFSRAKGLEQGFDEWRTTPGISFDAQTDNHITGDKMTALGIELLSKPELKSKPFFAWAHYMDPHDQYNRHPEAPNFGNKARDRYAQEIFYTDLWVKKLLDFLDQQPFGKDTYFVLSADHGEAFGEHGMYKHAFELWEVLTRVPLVVCGPGVKAQRISERRSHIDLVPTFLDALGQKPAAALPGKSLLPELTGAEPAQSREPIYLELAEDTHNPPRRAIIRGDYKLIWSGPGDKFQLFDLKQDPGEEKDLAKTDPATLKDMVAHYRAFLDKLVMIEPYGHVKLKEGGTARGPKGPKAD